MGFCPGCLVNTQIAAKLCSCLQGYTEEEATERALKIFETLDKNGDGSLAEEEFIKVGFLLSIIKII